ncbi:RAI1-domain-containing protein [Fistulina hepatica ATCC 64428]|uniref:Decapping nuclease n=1 Tax=Fistulina hepatica ATCC 64428 TaxID=1128425 RepID=A0A0D7A7E7_9AGAR|nr:RAI1-domain-containing protein [Fistulina hepatica ATCC 64428]
MSVKRSSSSSRSPVEQKIGRATAKRSKVEVEVATLSYPKLVCPTSIPQFQQPTPLLNFSYDASHALHFDNSSMKYYVDPPPHADLRHGYERWNKRPERKGRIDTLLRAWKRVQEKMAMPPDVMRGGVITWRGVMTKVLTAPYEERDAWDFNIMCVDRTIYIEDHLSDEMLAERDNVKPHQRQQMYYGYSFESWCTSSKPGVPEPGGWGGDVDTNVQWCSVVKTKLGDSRLFIGGEEDCKIPADKLSPRNDTLVELKTSMTIKNPRDEARFEKKLLKYYFQSFLLGVPEIIVGFRTPTGQLSTLQKFKTMQIPRMVRGKPNAWEPSICLSWGHRFLEFVKDIVSREENKVWRARFVPGEGVTLRLLDDDELLEVKAGESRFGFLPQWYVDPRSV